jgi:hypothetical protein
VLAVHGYGQAAFHRGEGPRHRCAYDHRYKKRNSLLAEQTRGFHPGDCRVYG